MSNEIIVSFVMDASWTGTEELARQLADAFAKIKRTTGQTIRLVPLDPDTLIESDETLLDFYRNFEEVSADIQSVADEEIRRMTANLQEALMNGKRSVLVGSPGRLSISLVELLGDYDHADAISQLSLAELPVFTIEREKTIKPPAPRGLAREWRRQAASHTRLIHKRYRGVR